MNVIVTPHGAGEAVIDWGAGARHAAVGRSGIGAKLREGDGVTPVGVFHIRRAWYRADRLARPQSAVEFAPLSPDDGWCDAPGDPNYNRLVRTPYPARHEALWRADHLYDVIVVLGFNDDPVVPGKGSAIFLHVAGPGPTEGCIALALKDLLELLAQLAPGDTVTVRA